MSARPLFLRHRDWAPILNLAFLILCGITGVAAVCYGSFQLGRYLAIDEARAAAAKIGIAVRMPIRGAARHADRLPGQHAPPA
jgi:hypothetical protein